MSQLGLTSEETNIYLALLEYGGDTAGNISKKTGLKRSTLYGILQKMTDKGVIKRSLKQGTRFFSAETPENLYTQFSKKINHLQKAQEDFQEILPKLNQLSKDKNFKPKIEVFDGINAVQNIMQDVLLYRNLEILTLWPIKPMIKMLSSEYFRWHNIQRIQNNLFIKAIWPDSQAVSIKEHPYMGHGEKHLREIRVIDGEINAQMGYWIYGNKIMYLASHLEAFGFIIESADMVQLQKDQWQILWNRSKKLSEKRIL